MNIDWNLIIILLPVIIIAVGLLVLMVGLAFNDSPTERERILQNTLDTLLEAQRNEISANKERQP